MKINAILFCLIYIFNISKTNAFPPMAPKIPDTLIIHGDTLIDNFYWLINKDDPEVIEYLESENDYLEIMLQPVEELKKSLYENMINRISETDMSVPYYRNGYWYYSRTETGKDHVIYCRKKGNFTSEEEIILDVNEFIDKYDYYSFFLTYYSISPDNNKAIIYGNKSGGNDIYLFIKDLKSGEIKEEVLSDVFLSIWFGNSHTILYEKANPISGHSYQVWLHHLNNPAKTDELIYEEMDPTYMVSIYASESQEYFYIASFGENESEVRFISKDDPDRTLQLIQAREQKIMYIPINHRDRFLIYTNFEAPDFRIMETDISKPGKENWKEIIPQNPGVLIVGFMLFKNYYVLEEINKGIYNIRIVNLQNNEQHYIDFPDENYFVSSTSYYNFYSDSLRFVYQSLTMPYSIFSYHMGTQEMVLLKQQKILDHNPELYNSERIWAKANDSTLIPISLFYKKEIILDGTHPVFMEGYGAYGYSFSPLFDDKLLPYVERGFIYAIAHVRGGSEMGWDWYESGKKFNKKNTINDFISCAEHLISEGYTKEGMIALKGESAGGILAGGVINKRPELFKAAILKVPFVDIINTMLDADLPLTTLEYEEWGNPENQDAYEYIKSYSPYDNVKVQDYSHLLFITGFNDALVGYWEAAKMVAKLRYYKTDDNLLLLRTIFEGGHGGPAGRYNKYLEAALEQVFILYVFEKW